MMNKAAIVIAIKDRPAELRSLLRNLEARSHRPDEVIVVDSSREASSNEDF